MTGGLHQMTITYSPEQDRMLLRVATTEKSEYQLWLTRRFIKVLWGAMVKTFEADPVLKRDVLPQVKDAVMAMQHQEAVQSADFSKPHAEDTRNLTSNTGPLLVIGGSISPPENGITKMALQTKEGSQINLALNQQLLHALSHMMITSAQRAEWDLEISVGDGNVVVPDEPAHLH